jgi:hypothetical protein
MFTENFEDPNIVNFKEGDVLLNTQPVYANGGRYSIGHRFTIISIEDGRYTLKDEGSDRTFQKSFMWDFEKSKYG